MSMYIKALPSLASFGATSLCSMFVKKGGDQASSYLRVMRSSGSLAPEGTSFCSQTPQQKYFSITKVLATSSQKFESLTKMTPWLSAASVIAPSAVSGSLNIMKPGLGTVISMSTGTHNKVLLGIVATSLGATALAKITGGLAGRTFKKANDLGKILP